MVIQRKRFNSFQSQCDTLKSYHLLSKSLLHISFALFLTALVGCEDDPPALQLTLSSEAEGVLSSPMKLTAALSETGGEFSWRLVEQPLGTRALFEARPFDPRTAESSSYTLTPFNLGVYYIEVTARKGDRSVKEAIEIELKCTIPAWSISLNQQRSSEGPESALRVGQEVALVADLNTQNQEGCPEVTSQVLSIDWGWRSWPLIDDGEAAPPSLSVIGERFVRFTPQHRGSYTLYARLTDDQGRNTEADHTIEVSCGQALPTAQASILEGALPSDDPQVNAITIGRPVQVLLQGEDPDSSCAPELNGLALSLQWNWDQKPAGSQAQLDDRGRGVAGFTPDVMGQYSLRGSVTDSEGLTQTTTLQFQAGACLTRAPQIEEVTTSASIIDLGESVSLTVEWSDSDLIESCLGENRADYSVRWWVDRAPPESISQPLNSQRENAVFTPDKLGEYELIVEITDPQGQSARSSQVIEVTQCALRPLALSVSSSANEVIQGSLVSLFAEAELVDYEGRCGLAPEDEPELNLEYLWRTVELPAGASGLSITNRPMITWRAEVAGRYVFEVRASDSLGRISPFERIEVIVAECGSTPPSIERLGFTGELAVGQLISFSAEVSDLDTRCGVESVITHQWRVISRPRSSLVEFIQDQRSRPRPTLSIDRSGTYIVELEVTDQSGLSASSQVEFNVTPCGEGRPVVDLTSTDDSPVVGSWISLFADASDPDSLEGCDLDQPLSYHWQAERLPEGYASDIHLEGPSSNVYIERAGVYQFSVFVQDTEGHLSDVSSVVIQVEPCGRNPVQIQSVLTNPALPSLGEPVQFLATWVDPDAQCGLDLSDTAILTWQLVTKPQNSLTILSEGQTPSLIPDRAGLYRVRVVAATSDGLMSEPFDLELDVNGCGGANPVITSLAASRPDLSAGNSVVFTVISGDADREGVCALNDPHTYRWRLRAKPAGSLATVSPRIPVQNGDSQANLLTDLEGVYQVEVIVTDSRGFEAREAITVTASACGRSIPSLDEVNLSEAVISLGESVTLSGLATPPDLECLQDQRLHWSWRILSRPSQSTANLSSEQAERPSFTPDRPGSYVFQAQVSTGTGEVSNVLTLELNVEICGEEAPEITSLTSSVDPNDLILGNRLQLTVTGQDPDEACGLAEPFRAEWSVLNIPTGSELILSQISPTSVSLIPDLPGVYEIQATLTEVESGKTSTPQVITLIAGLCGGLPPDALVGVSAPLRLPPAEQIELLTFTCQDAPFIQLDASQSSDPNSLQCGVEEFLSYLWTVREVTPGLSVGIQGIDREAVNLSIDGLGVYQIGQTQVEVEVTGLRGLKDRAQAIITAQRLPSPETQGINPDLFCAGERVVTLTGEGFISVDGELPEINIGGQTLVADRLENCTPIPDAPIEICNTLVMTVPAQLNSGLLYPVVRNPYPLGCIDTDVTVNALLVSAPQIDNYAPNPICRGQFNGDLTLRGSGFLKNDQGEQAIITVNGENTTQTILAGCALVAGDLNACDQATFPLPASQIDVSELLITVANPPTAGCDPSELSASLTLIQSEPPQIDNVDPRKICDQGGILTLSGDHFEPNMIVDLGPYRADQVVNTLGELEVDAIWERREQPRFEAGLYTLSARNASGCEESFSEPIRVTEGPVPFFVDPPVIYSGINLQATAYLGNLFGGSVSKVEIQTDGADPVELEFSADPNKPSVINLFLPQGLPDGDYDLTLYDEVDCPGTTPSLLKVTSDLSVTITEVTPPFAWSEAVTPLILFANPNAGFEPTPRSYLSPSSASDCVADDECQNADLCRDGRCVSTCVGQSDCGQGSACVSGACLPQAAELRAATLNSVEELRGAIASGFQAGDYDLVVVNPDGSVGLLESAITVIDLPPPEVDGVSPGSWETNNPALQVQVSGENFRDVIAEASCLTNGVSSTEVTPVINQTSTLLTLSVNTSSLRETSVCQLKVTNSDNSFVTFSPITATNPSGNFVSFGLGPALPDGYDRRLSAVTFAQIPNGPAKLFVFGGDQGTENQALDDNLSVGLNAFGALQQWEVLPTRLPSARTRIEAHTVDHFIYIAGGYDSDLGGPTDEIIRAELLDPLYVPVIDQVDFEFDDGINGLDSGVYYYRVSAIYGPSDQNNPDGESLSSEAQPVFIPDIPVGVRLVLTWIGLPDAVGYRIYRSPRPDQLFGEEELMAELDATTFVWSDEGQEPINPKRPLKIGELGNWKVVGHLNSPRTRHGTIVAPDPIIPDLYHLYAIGGLINGTDTAQVERLSIDVSQSRSHTLTPQVNGFPKAQLLPTSLSLARSELKTLKATNQEGSLLPIDKVYLYALGGNGTRRVEVTRVLSGGLLSGWQNDTDMQRSRNGYVSAIANNTLVVICGQNGSSNSSAEKGKVCGQVDCPASPEHISSWASLGNTNAQNCLNPGSTSARGFFYLIGGSGAAGDASTKVDISLLGGTP